MATSKNYWLVFMNCIKWIKDPLSMIYDIWPASLHHKILVFHHQYLYEILHLWIWLIVPRGLCNYHLLANWNIMPCQLPWNEHQLHSTSHGRGLGGIGIHLDKICSLSISWELIFKNRIKYSSDYKNGFVIKPLKYN